jgi:nucleotide-binding universal stress UspA family protein
MVGGIVVGVDGSGPSRGAARWAAAEALSGDLPLRLVYCIPSDAPVAVARFEARAGTERLRKIAGQDVHAVTGDAVDVDGVLTWGPVVRSLVEQSRHAALLVVARRGHGGFATLPGSTSTQVAAHAACPVAVVRDAGMVETGAPVLVGVDGSASAQPALQFAFARAAARHTRLVALHAWRPPRSFGSYPLETVGLGVADEERIARGRLATVLRPWQRRYPLVAVEQRTVQGHSVARLTEAARSVEVLVVGSRGLSTVSGLMRSSVSQGVLRHAHRPVVIVRRPVVPDYRDGAGTPQARISPAPALVLERSSRRG